MNSFKSLKKMQNNVKRETCDSDEREKVVDKKLLVREPRLKFWSPKLRIFCSGRAPEPADAVNGFWPAINIPLFQELSSQKSKLVTKFEYSRKLLIGKS